MTVAGMLLVNNPGSWSAIYEPLEHAPWNGWTPTDLVFPFFLFIVGVTTHLSLSARRERGATDGDIVRQVLRRGATIFAIGLLLNWNPGFWWGEIDGVPDPTVLQRVAYRVTHLRIMGVLPRIGVAYTISALLTLRGSLERQVATASALLLGYWFAITLIPVPGTGAWGVNLLDWPAWTLQGWVDRAILGPNHIWSGSETFDPEGILSTIPAAVTAMLGTFAGRWIASDRPLAERLTGLFGAGALAAALGLMWSWSLPINKNLWTSSYALFTGGLASLTLATTMWLVDGLGVRRWVRPFVIFGTNPIVAFAGSSVMARLIYTLIRVPFDGSPTSLEAAIYWTAYASWLPPKDASLLFAITFVLLWLALLTPLHRRGWFLKV
jgi:predicted acyltransferase